MKMWIIGFLFKFVTIENISAVAAKCIVWLLEYCRSKGDKYWDTAKNIIRKINNWCSLFLEVYEDDTLSPEEEAKIAEAIKNQTDIKTIVKILKKVNKRSRSYTHKPKNKVAKAVKQLSIKIDKAKRN